MTGRNLKKIKKAAEKIRKESEVLVVIGIGGSYLGAKAAVDFLTRGSKIRTADTFCRKFF